MQYPSTYRVISETYIDDVHATGTLLEHVRTGARVALLANDDENKVFNIAFRTPPTDSTGVAHIIEHSVLCGSEKFPLKDPFVELVKGSLNTFLNAMTYPDKTMYPVASCNDQDFQNLMDVYLDAVFHPNIYRNEKIFRQEGWHYELHDTKEPLRYNGVVYNEMKGAFSSADEVLERQIFNDLFPDTPYGVESGGDPANIPDLTYEDFLAFHKKYYHPSNSYIYLYGDMDMVQKLTWLDEAYLCHYDRIEVPSAIPAQASFTEARRLTHTYPVLAGEPLHHNTYLTWNAVVSDFGDVERNMAFSILTYVLLDAPGAPVKQALLDAHIGMDVEGAFSDGILQPFLSIAAKKAEAADADRFLAVIKDTLQSLASEGLDQKAIASGINYYEFRFREADYGAYPKGLMYGLALFDSWLYDDNRPFDYLRQLAVFASLREKAKTGYFEQLIRDVLLPCRHAALVTLAPEAGLAEKMEQQTAAVLAAKKASLTEEGLQQLVRETEALQAYQEAEDAPEVKDCLPTLQRADIARKTPIKLSAQKCLLDGTALYEHHFQTNGIAYLNLLFDTEKVPSELVPYLGLLKSVLGVVSTAHYSYGALFHEINANTGGIYFGLQVAPLHKEEDGSAAFLFGVRAKYLYPQQDFVFRMIREILLSSDLADQKRLKEIIASARIEMQQSLPAAGNASAIRRALSYQSRTAAWQEQTGGIGQYHLLEQLDDHFDEMAEDITAKLTQLMHIVFRPENLTVGLAADGAGFDGLAEQVRGLKEVLYTDAVPTGGFTWERCAKNEGFKTPGQVQYVAMAGNYRRAGFAYTGAFRILRTILNYDYLWNNLRVLGGAYGCMGIFPRSGDSALASYRDPHLARTLGVYRALPDYLRSFAADERTMTKFIIGTVSELDTPMNASARAALSLACAFSGLTEADFQKERDEVLDAQPADIRALADAVQAVIDADNICVIGSEAKLEKDAAALKEVRPLN